MAGRREGTAVLLALLQALDLAYTCVSPEYGPAHLDHLGVPPAVRPALPVIKAGAVIGLGLTVHRPRARAVLGLALVSYYSAAVSFHRAAGDPVAKTAPAAVMAALAASLV